jgi:carbamoyl-phosphate synthase small subunit
VTMTAPQIGNTGTNSHDDQSRRPWVAGFVVRDSARLASSWRSDESLDDYLVRHGVPAIAEIDTRRLTRHLRSSGAMRGAISTEITDPDDLVDLVKSSPSYVGRDLAIEVTTTRPYQWTIEELDNRAVSGYAAGRESTASTAALVEAAPEPRYRIAAFDYGLKRNILDLLVASGYDVTVVPGTTGANEILERGYAGVFLSNGPGDPEPVTYAIAAMRGLLGRIPIFGICLGHQILGLAVGGRTFKLPFGHRGSNHPVKRIGQDHVEITCQNHGFAVDTASLEHTPARLTHVNLNDHTVEGLAVDGLCYSVQYHPEAGPGPHDSRYLFAQFRELIERFEPAEPSLPVD